MKQKRKRKSKAVWAVSDWMTVCASFRHEAELDLLIKRGY